MKKLALALMISTALIAPTAAQAANVTITTQMKNYGGKGAYLAVYLVDTAGNYNSTLWVAGTKSKYWGHLRGWARGVSAAGLQVDGLTGASVGSGRTLTVTADIADALIEAGYQVVVDSSVEHMGDYTADATVALENGASASGSGFVSTLSVQM